MGQIGRGKKDGESMGDVEILLLDAGGGKLLCMDLEQWIRSHTGREIRQIDLHHQPEAGKVERLFTRFAPRLCFVLLSGEGTLPGEWLPRLRRAWPQLPIVLVAGAEQADNLPEWCRSGAVDILTTPLRLPELVFRLRRWLPETPNEEATWTELKERLGLMQFVGDSPAFQGVVKKIPTIAGCGSGVLIMGETGTGKEIFARAIHYLSRRAGGPFIPLNCGAIPTELVENELFGHVSGAYTGAASAAPGLAQEADGGTLFLDEVDALPAAAQVKLLRFLQEKEFRPLGSQKTLKADVRVLAATNTDLQRAVERGSFRRDLFYRLNVLSLVLPPLRDRESDVILLSWHFLRKFSGQSERPVTFSAAALEKLKQYAWPGNVRELESVIERSVIFAQRNSIEASDIQLPTPHEEMEDQSLRARKARVIAQFEQSYLRQMLAAHEHNISRAAKAAGKDRRAFWELMRKYDLHHDVRPAV